MSAHRLHAVAHQMQQERREFGRRRAVWHAWIIPSSLQRLPCCVRNVSDGGALLELSVPEWLPATFELAVDGPNLRLPCELNHRGKHGVGVTFTDPELSQELMDYCNLPVSGNDRPTPGSGGGLAPPRLTSEMIKHVLRQR